MNYIENERYTTMLEHIPVYDNKFICSYIPVYGLVKVKDFIMKINRNTGVVYSDGNNIIVKYIREKVYTEGIHGEQLSIDEICNILNG